LKIDNYFVEGVPSLLNSLIGYPIGSLVRSLIDSPIDSLLDSRGACWADCL